MIKKVVEIDVQADDAIQDINSINKGIKNVDESAQKAEDSTQDLSASAVDGAKNFKFMGVSINSVSKSLKVLRVSLIATGIGAIVVAVGALAAAFLSTQKGIDKLNSVLIPLKEVLETVWGIAQKLGDGLFKIVSGDVKEGFDQIKSSVKGVGDELAEAVKRGNELYDLKIRIETLGINQSLVLSRQNRLLSEQLEIAEDVTKSEEDRRKAFVEARANAELITKIKLQELDLRIKDAKLRTKANDTDREAQKDLNDLLAQQEEIKAAGTRQQTLLLKKQNAVKAEGKPDKEEVERNVLGYTFEEWEELQKQNREHQKAEDEKRRSDAELQAAYEAEVEAAEIAAEDARLERLRLAAEKELEIERAKNNAKIDIAVQSFRLLSSLFDQSTAAGKAAAAALIIAEQIQAVNGIIQNTAIANAKALALSPLTFGQPFITFNTISAGIGIASSVAAGVKALSQIGSGGGGVSAGSVSQSGGGARQQAVSPDFNIAGSSGINQIADIVGEQVNKPVKAFVVSNEVTTGQALDRSIVGTAGIG